MVIIIFTIYKEHRHFGKQIFKLSFTELKKQYKGAAIGPLWALIKPAFTLFVYWFAFTVGIKNLGEVDINIAGKTVIFDRFIFMLTGFVPWWFISESITHGAKAIRVNRQFVTKVKFPVSTILTYTSISRVYIHFLLVAIMMLILGIYDAVFGTGYISLYALQFIVLCPIMFMFFLGLSWGTAPMCAFSKDLESMITSIMSGIFWLTGVIYSSYDLPKTNMQTILEFAMIFNPINFFVNSYRKAFIYHEFFWVSHTPDPTGLGINWELVIFIAEFLLIVTFGARKYKSLRKTLPDVL
ncbi:MAG: ABC transporter permease [Ruminococcus sp.]|nr:ABC transporter permease [Ruminococcus sp.]